MLKHQLVGRLSSIVGICVLGTACIGGEIGDSAGGARLAPDASDPGVGIASDPGVGINAPSLVCPGASADVSASSGWRSSEASQPASGALRFEFKARPTAADLNGLVAVGAQDIDAFSETAIAVRFAEDGFVDARDGGLYNSDVNYPYDPGVWYSVSVSADIQNKTYDVEIGPCGESQQKLIDDAAFRDDASVSDQLSTWAVWSSQSAALEVATPAWMASGSCMPSTCETLGHVCGQPSDGCGGFLSCGNCSTGQVCTGGSCIDEPAPPPPCQPATCQTLSAECGTQNNGCGGFLSCGNCSTGQMCTGGTCIDEPAPPPPGTNWWDIYDQPDATNTGPNCSAAGCPSATLSTGNAPPDTITQSICNSQPGCTWSNFIKNGKVRIEAKGVTFYNFQISSGSSAQGVEIRDTNSGSSTDLTMEYGEIVGGSGCGENVHGMGWTARYMEIHNCDDNAKVHTDGTNGHGPVLVEYSWLYNAWGGHGDNFQNVTHNANDPITVRRNNIEGGGTAVLFLDNIHTVTLENNWIYWGDDTDCGSPVYCGVSAVGGGDGNVFVRENLWDRMYETHGGCFDLRCAYGDNRWSDDYSLFSP